MLPNAQSRFGIEVRHCDRALCFNESVEARLLVAVVKSGLWVDDIAYIPTEEGWLYLTIVAGVWLHEVIDRSVLDMIITRLGNPYDDAVAESFFKMLRRELINNHNCRIGE